MDSPPADSLQDAPVSDVDDDDEVEIDELDSDSDADASANGAHPFSRKPTSGLPGVRVPGQSLLPAIRIENIITADGTTGNLSLSKEGLHVLSIATEEFIKRMAQAGHRQASSQRRNAVQYSDMAVSMQQYQEFMFLNDTIPMAIALSEALQLRTAKERELLEEDPAMAPPAIGNTLSTHHMHMGSSFNNKSKNRNTNGKDKANGISVGTRPSESVRGPEIRPTETQWIVEDPSEGTVHVDNRDRRTLTIPFPPQVGTSISFAPSRLPLQGPNGYSDTLSGTSTPGISVNRPQSPVHHESHPPHVQEDPVWPGQFMGPASGFLQGPGGPFGRQEPGHNHYPHSLTPD